MSVYDLNCPFCDKVYKLPREKVVKHVGKTIYCRGCGNPFSVPPLPQFELPSGESLDEPELPRTPANSEIDDKATVDVANYSETNGKNDGRSARKLTTRDALSREAMLRASSADQSAAENSVSREFLQIDESLSEQSMPQLPPPFSAAVLPPISEVLPSTGEPPDFEPPTVDLASMADASSLESVDPPPYRQSAEQGAIAVDEEASFFHDDDSAEGISATAELPVLPTVSAAEIQRSLEPSPPVLRSSTPATLASAPKAQSNRNIPPSPVQIPPGLNLDDVPIARAVNPAPSPAPVVSINIKPLQRRLTILILMSFLIALLLAAILLAMLGYIPHRPA